MGEDQPQDPNQAPPTSQWPPDANQPHAELPAFPDGTFGQAGGGEASPVPEGAEQLGEQVVDQPSASTEETSVGEAEVTSRSPQASADGHWDEQKAETLAEVFRQKEPEDVGLRHAQKLVDEHNGVRLLMAEQPEKAEVLTGIESKLQATGEEITERSNKFLSPYEELYDLNPDMFADMPTKQFVGLAQELQVLSIAIENNQEDQELFEAYDKQLKSAFANQQLVGRDTMVSFAYMAGTALDLDDNDRRQLVKEILSATDDSFDKTPRQIMEVYQEDFEDCKAKFSEKQAVWENEKKNFLDQYRPAAPEQVEPEAT